MNNKIKSLLKIKNNKTEEKNALKNIKKNNKDKNADLKTEDVKVEDKNVEDKEIKDKEIKDEDKKTNKKDKKAKKTKKQLKANKGSEKQPSFVEKLKANRKYAKNINWFTEHWLELMAKQGLYNSVKETYSLNHLKVTNFGYECDIFLADCCTFAILDSDKTRECIENGYGCMLILNKTSKRSRMVHAEFIFHAPDNLKFSLVKVKPYEVYIGNRYNGEPIIINLVKYPHIMLSGGTRAGKLLPS